MKVVVAVAPSNHFWFASADNDYMMTTLDVLLFVVSYRSIRYTISTL